MKNTPKIHSVKRFYRDLGSNVKISTVFMHKVDVGFKCLASKIFLECKDCRGMCLSCLLKRDEFIMLVDFTPYFQCLRKYTLHLSQTEQ